MEREEAMKILKDFHDKSALFSVRTALDTIIPELKKSEDEMMRKDCIKYLDWEYQHCSINEHKMKIEKCIAWLEKQEKQKPVWCEEDEVGFGDTIWAIKQARDIAKDESDMGNLWYAERWLKSIKERMKGEEE